MAERRSAAGLGAVFGAHGMGQDTILRNLALLNVLWEGGEMAINQRSKPSFVLRGRRLTFGLMVQPEALRGFLERACSPTWIHRHLLPRRSGSDAWLRNDAIANDTDRVPTKRIYQYVPNCVRDSRDLRAALAILSERGRARMEEGGRRRSVAINPALLDGRE